MSERAPLVPISSPSGAWREQRATDASDASAGTAFSRPYEQIWLVRLAAAVEAFEYTADIRAPIWQSGAGAEDSYKQQCSLVALTRARV